MASSAPPPPPQPQLSAPLPPTRSGDRSGGRDSYGGRGGGGRGGNYGRTGGRGRGNHSGGGRGRGGGSHPSNYSSNSGPSLPPMPRSANAVPYGFVPAYLPGAASLVEQLDRRLLVILRDGRHLVGTLSTFDQFSNMVLQETSERRILVAPRKITEDDGEKHNVGPKTICYQTDIQLGLFIVRGDNVVLLGEVEDDEESDGDHIKFVSLEEFEMLEEEEAKRKDENGGDEPVNWDFDMDLVA
ncbi:hypothetical protein ACHAWF_008720 [Thalassiosira exigua]